MPVLVAAAVAAALSLLLLEGLTLALPQLKQ